MSSPTPPPPPDAADADEPSGEVTDAGEPSGDPSVVVIAGPAGPAGEGGAGAGEAVEHPAKVMRIASMIKQLLEEVRHAPLDEPGRTRLREIYETSVGELGTTLSPDLRDELARMTLPFAGVEAPSEPELRIAQAQLVGWLDGLFHGIQATVFAQQMAARTQMEHMRQRGLPAAGEDSLRGVRPPGYL